MPAVASGDLVAIAGLFASVLTPLTALLVVRWSLKYMDEHDLKIKRFKIFGVELETHNPDADKGTSEDRRLEGGPSSSTE